MITSLPPTPTFIPASPSASLPTPTSVPLAARINGEGITLAEYQAELARFQAAQATSSPGQPDQGQARVMDDLVDQVLLAQAAAENGFRLEDQALQSRIQKLADQAGGMQVLTEWIAAHGYSDDTFRRSLARSIAAAWMRDRIASQVAGTADQVHARQILVYNEDQAKKILAQLQAGTDFATEAAKVDPVSGGDLGWFPRGYLTEPALDEAAFSLQPGQISPIIQTPLGFHILQVIERDPMRPLSPDARLALQEKTVKDWLEKRRSQSHIEILINN